jgi:hypothetical protein
MIGGSAMSTSMIRWLTLSMRPPRYPVTTPHAPPIVTLIASELVRAHRELAARRLVGGELRVLGAVGRELRREHGGDDEEQHDERPDGAERLPADELEHPSPEPVGGGIIGNIPRDADDAQYRIRGSSQP